MNIGSLVDVRMQKRKEAWPGQPPLGIRCFRLLLQLELHPELSLVAYKLRSRLRPSVAFQSNFSNHLKTALCPKFSIFRSHSPALATASALEAPARVSHSCRRETNAVGWTARLWLLTACGN